MFADIREGRRCPRLERIASGPIDFVAGVLAANRYLRFVFFPRMQNGNILPCCGPTSHAAAELGRRVLGLPAIAEPTPCHSQPVARPDAALAELRSDAIEEAIDQLVDCLSLREDLTFALTWQVTGMSEPRLDYSAGLGEEDARCRIAAFLREALGIDVPRQRSGPIMEGYYGIG